MRSKPSGKPDSAPHPHGPGESPSREVAPAISSRHSPTFHQILVPIDFSDCSATAFEYAVALGQKFGTRITLLHVVEPAVYPENYLVAPTTLDDTNQNLIGAGRERLAHLRERGKSLGLTIDTLVRMGRAQSEIGDTAKAIGADLIIMGTHGHGGLKHVLLGGTAERVVRQAPCPVLTVRHQ
jgi:nucleotide-binding universal stress UspA family protein